ncbi:MAG TPA: YkgJ family cysteine cluster protein [Bacteroidia bacterium]|nr:YkgJ family cysteine cluster protein [Bacteroidia bacterium]HRS58560.1 YkgJ family cysteine cluster protein [Bacteroidia bacterium]HRU68402.1 YkgJ family cysteine cluster protein [Bacteroidia bacterium]
MKTREELSKILERAIQNQHLHKSWIKKLKRADKHELDRHFHLLHQEEFKEIDCLQCANCCQTTGPRLLNADINRISRYLRMKPSDFTENYLRIDEDGDYVFQSMPCPFLEEDNYCRIYEHRPVACREYPHTDRDRMYQILDLTARNALICPAVAIILEKMSKDY